MLRWLAPETLKHKKYSLQSDVWAYGVTLWEIMTDAATPYSSVSDVDLPLAVLKGARPELPSGLPSEIVDILNQCWAIDLKMRPSIDAIAARIFSFASASPPVYEIAGNVEIYAQNDYKLTNFI